MVRVSQRNGQRYGNGLQELNRFVANYSQYRSNKYIVSLKLFTWYFLHLKVKLCQKEKTQGIVRLRTSYVAVR